MGLVIRVCLWSIPGNRSRILEMGKKTIIFTGGGSGGHVVPALTLIDSLKKLEDQYQIEYIGGQNSIESELVPEFVGKYHSISTGKLRRYFSIQNFIDLFKVALGTLQSFLILLGKPSNTLIFSTGGFVSVPVVVAAWLTGKKIFIHEQTARVGLANKIASKFAQKVFISFEESMNFFPQGKTVLSGYPLRAECFTQPDQNFFFEEINLKDKGLPVLFITGGGNGSKLLNDMVKKSINNLSDKYFIIHQVGKQFIDEFKELETANYKPIAFVKQNMIEILKKADITISRAGAGTVCELMALKKTSVFIPLKIAQKNEQFHNAKEAEQKIGSVVIEEDEALKMSLEQVIEKFESREQLGVSNYQALDGTDYLLDEIGKS